MGYIEAYAILDKGQDSKGKSKCFFKDVFKEIFEYSCSGQLETIADEVWDKVRNGLYHNFIFKQDALIYHDINNAFKKDKNLLLVNPLHVFKAIKEHHNTYIKKLKNGIGINNFSKIFKPKIS